MTVAPTASWAAVCALAFLLPVAFSTSVFSGFWSPKAVLLLLATGWGLPLLLAQVREGSRQAAAALVVMVVALVATLLSPSPLLSFVGAYNLGTGWLYVAGLVACWAIARRLSSVGVNRLEQALIAAVLGNVVIGLLTPFVDFYVLRLDPDGHAQGLVGNPGPYGVLLVCGMTLLLPRFANRPARWLLPIIATAAAVELSASRGPFLAMLGLVGAFVLVKRPRVMVTAMLVAAVVVGVGGMQYLLERDEQPDREAQAQGLPVETTTRTATGRIAAGSEAGGRARIEAWRAGAEALGERPLLGWGPGRFREATASRRTVGFARAEGGDRLFLDAHNIVVEYGTTTGVLGLTAMAVWLSGAFRRARGPLSWFAAVGLSLHLVEPMIFGVTPLLFLALGAAGRVVATPVGRSIRMSQLVGTFASATLSMGLLLGDFHYEQARLDYALPDATSAARLLAPWPDPVGMEARIHLLEAIVADDDPEQVAASRRLRAAAIRRDPTDPGLWNDAGELDLSYGQLESAERRFQAALRNNPWSTRGLVGLGRVRVFQHRYADAVAPLRRARMVEDTPEVERLLDLALHRGRRTR